MLSFGPKRASDVERASKKSMSGWYVLTVFDHSRGYLPRLAISERPPSTRPTTMATVDARGCRPFFLCAWGSPNQSRDEVRSATAPTAVSTGGPSQAQAPRTPQNSTPKSPDMAVPSAIPMPHASHLDARPRRRTDQRNQPAALCTATKTRAKMSEKLNAGLAATRTTDRSPPMQSATR